MKVLEKVNEIWWWAEVNDKLGYVPANHLSVDSSEPEDMWQNDEYFSSYEALVSSSPTSLMVLHFKYVFAAEITPRNA